MAVRHDYPTSHDSPRVGDTVVLRPTRRQRLGSALLKALCATPLLLALPVTSGGQRVIVIWVAILSAIAAVGIDLLAERDIWVKLSPTGLTTRAGSVPWWAVDEIQVRDATSTSTILVRSFETFEMTLPAPRNGPTGANPHFDAEARLIVASWKRYNRVQPTDPPGLQAVLDRAEASAMVRDLEPGTVTALEMSSQELTGLIDLRASDGATAPASEASQASEGLGGEAADDREPGAIDLTRMPVAPQRPVGSPDGKAGGNESDRASLT
jgi:hypothetical protein